MHATSNIFQSMFFPHIIDDEFVSAIVAHVTESVRAVDVSRMRRRKAQRLIEGVACQAVAEMWTAAFRRPYHPTKSWPQATAILLDNPRRCVLELWIGHEYHAADTPDPVEIFLDGE